MSRKRQPPVNGASPPAAPVVPAKRLMLSVRQRRHRAALMKAAAQWVMARFTTAMGGDQPELFIQESDGRLEPADVDVVIDVVAGFEREAECLRVALVQLLDKSLWQITEAEVPVIEDTEATREEIPATRENRRKQNGRHAAPDTM